MRALLPFSVVGLLFLGAVQALGQTAQSVNAETRKKLQEIKEAVKESQEVARDADAQVRRTGTVTPNALAIQEASRALKEAEKASANLPSKLAPVPKISPAMEIPAAYSQEDALERLRRNQKALTDQRIGDYIILQSK